MTERHLVLILSLAACGTGPGPQLADVRLGIGVDELRLLYPDTREVEELDAAGAVEAELGDTSGAVALERGPEGSMIRQSFLFREGQLSVYAVTYDETADSGEIRSQAEAEHGPPTLARTVAGSSATVWERSDYVLSILALGGQTERGAPKTIVVLKAEPSGSKVILAVILGFIGVGLVNLISVWPVMHGFTSKVRRIQTPSDMAHFKRVAARSMHGALVQIVVLLAPGVIWGWAQVAGRVTWAEGRLCIGAYLLVIGAAAIVKRAEDKVKGCPVTDELRIEKESVIHIWKTRALPKF